MAIASALPDNPRERIGGNNPPADDLLFIDRRIVADAGEYLQFRFKNLANLYVSGKSRAHKRPMGFRKTLEYCLEGIVTQESLAEIIGRCRETIGEDQARVKVWAEMDDEFASDIEHVRQAVIGHVSVNVARLEAKLEAFVRDDPRLRRLEDQKRAHELAEKRALIAAADLDARQRARKTDAALKRALKGAPNAEAIRARHAGPRETARKLSREALGVIESMALKKLKHRHLKTYELNAEGLAECLRLGLAQDAEPFMSKAPERERMVGPTQLGLQCYHEALQQGLIAKPKPKRARQALSEMGEEGA